MRVTEKKCRPLTAGRVLMGYGPSSLKRLYASKYPCAVIMNVIRLDPINTL